MTEVLLSLVSGSTANFISQISKIIFSFLAFVVITSLLMGVLPDDPFRGAIESWVSFLAPYGSILNTFIPVKFVVSSTLFAMSAKYFLWLYKKAYGIVMDKDADETLDV